jgi:hypothetical protein
MSLIGRFPHSHSEASSLLSKRFSGETVQKLVKENRVDLPDTAICPCIKNIVATLNLGVKIDLKVLAKKCKNTEYNPKASNIVPTSGAFLFKYLSNTVLSYTAVYGCYHPFERTENYCSSL